MQSEELIQQGAEGRIFKSTFKATPCVIKERFVKKYRHPELDHQLAKERMRAEVKALERCKKCGITTPTVYLADLDKRRIYMEYFANSITVKEFISKANNEQIHTMANIIGKQIATMHANRISHGDLTTSNILVLDDKQPDNDLSIAIIDFGLAHLDANDEDKGVDLYVLERALLSTHSTVPQLFSTILDSYKTASSNCTATLKRFEEVRARGRKRTMIG